MARMRFLQSEGNQAEVKKDMTPMIDVVFQLIIFFMLCTQVTNASIESLKLPISINCIPDDKPPKDRLLVNITGKGEIKVMGNVIAEKDLGLQLKAYAMQHLGKDGFSDSSILIRADQQTSYKYIQKVLVLCMGAKIWMIDFATSKEENH